MTVPVTAVILIHRGIVSKPEGHHERMHFAHDTKPAVISVRVPSFEHVLQVGLDADLKLLQVRSSITSTTEVILLQEQCFHPIEVLFLANFPRLNCKVDVMTLQLGSEGVAGLCPSQERIAGMLRLESHPLEDLNDVRASDASRAIRWVTCYVLRNFLC